MSEAISPAACAALFTEARTHNGWQARPVSDEQLREIYALLKMGPTSANCSPARFVFIRTPEGKEKLPELFPHGDARSWFTSSPQMAEETAFRNSSLQAAYLIFACRALGLDTGPMSGFDRDKVDAAFFADGAWKSNLLINIGYGDPGKLYGRLPRLPFDDACQLA